MYTCMLYGTKKVHIVRLSKRGCGLLLSVEVLYSDP